MKKRKQLTATLLAVSMLLSALGSARAFDGGYDAEAVISDGGYDAETTIPGGDDNTEIIVPDGDDNHETSIPGDDDDQEAIVPGDSDDDPEADVFGYDDDQKTDALGGVHGKQAVIPGSVRATLRLDYTQKWTELENRGIQVELFQEDISRGTVDMTDIGASSWEGYTFEVSARDKSGAERIGSALPSALDLTVSGLDQGQYTLRFTGTGYADYSVPFEIRNYSQYIEIGTGDGTFALGDFNGDGRVDEYDRELLSKALGSQNAEDIAKYDLNGDSKVNIVDLAYVNRNIHTPDGMPRILDTTCLTSQLDPVQAELDLEEAGTTVIGDFEDIFREDASVRFERSDGSEGNIVIPVTLLTAIPPADEEPLTMQIVTPANSEGTIREGFLTVLYEDNTTEDICFDNTQPAGIHAIARAEGKNVITISLGNRVAVKKVTITVTATEGGEYAVVETIRFLQNIVSDDEAEPNQEVKNLRATAGDKQVELTWDVLPNVTGYRVKYWQQGQESSVQQITVGTNSATITNLDNLMTYYFTVTPISDGWEGVESASIEATPQPSSKPSAPDMITVKEQDGQLLLSWKAAENATYYEVYYASDENVDLTAYRQFGEQITETSVTVTGLTNGTTYYFYLVAGNEIGKSGLSRIATGTPQATDYTAPTGLPTEGLLDRSKIKEVRLAAPNNYDPNAYTADAPFNVNNIIDGDYRTHWTVRNWYSDEHVIVTFTEPVDLSAALWVPRLDGDYPSYLRAYSVRVWYDGEDPSTSAGHLLVPLAEKEGAQDRWDNISNYNTRITDRFGFLPFGPAKNVIQISVAAEQDGYSIISLSELMFLEYDPDHCLQEDIAGLFADDLHTTLSASATQERIDELKTRLADPEERLYCWNITTLEDELKLAQELLGDGTGNGVTSGLILDGIQSRSNSLDNSMYGQAGSELQPLGVAVKARQEITIYASGIPSSASVKVYATQYNAEVNAWNVEMGELSNGRNVFSVPTIGSGTTPQRGGSLYLTYSGANPEAIKVHVRRATDIPVLELYDWYSLDDTVRNERIGQYVDELSAYVSAQRITSANATSNCLNVTEISLPTVLLSLPADAVLNANGLNREDKIENLYQNVLAWEDLMHICKTTQGIDNTYEENDMTSRQNIRCMQMFTGAFMYAAGNHIGIGYASCSGMASGQPISKLGADADANSLFGWGIAHEIGHNMDKLGKAEITNNIYSLMVQTYDGKRNTLTSRLEASDKYPSIFTRTAQGWVGASNDVFLQLGMYWQLHLAYDTDSNPMDFYNRFFKAWKAGAYTSGASSYDEKVALTAAGVANKDLTEFFTRWGMSLSQSVKNTLAGYPAENRAIWYLSDQSRRAQLAGTSAAIGSVNATTELADQKTIRVSINHDVSGTLQGFEILRNGTSIDFVLPGENGSAVYDDVIQSGNHRTYTYTVKAYDILGNQVGNIVEAGTVRIAYDQVVDSNAYTITRDGTTVTIQFKESTSVSGLKLSGVNCPDSGEYTITIDASFTNDDDQLVEKIVTARTGSFDKGNQAVDDTASYLTYFQKPGTGDDDTRIWTYDAKTITIAGIPSTLEDENIQLISYAGDDIGFWTDGAVGRLSVAYGDIPADSLIIVGTYRGDPRFNIIQIMGRFSKTTAEDGVEPTYVERPIDGDLYLFAEIPEDEQVSDISDGIFIFVPNVQREAELQSANACTGDNLLPSQMQAVLYRTDTAGSADSKRVTAETLWMMTPGGTDLPLVVLE